MWAIRAGNADQADRIFLDQSCLALCSIDLDNDASQILPSRAAFTKAFDQAQTRTRQESVPILASQLYRFVHELRIGDHVIYPRKIDRTLRLGEITGPYMYQSVDAYDYAHRRNVRWLGRLSRDTFSPGALYELGSVLHLFEISAFAEEVLQSFIAAKSGKPAPHAPETRGEETEIVVRDMVEITQDFISKKLNAELKGYSLEPFVASLFRAMGYRAHATRSTRDDGIDVIAHRDELGIEPPILKIQVKSQEANVGADQVKAFYAMVQARDVGIYITTGGYSSAARDFAKQKGNLKLVTGVEFVELIQKYYAELDLQFRQQIPLRTVLVPDVARDQLRSIAPEPSCTRAKEKGR